MKIGSASDGQETWRNANPEEYTFSDAQYPQRTLCFHTIHHVGQTYSVEYSYETHMNYVDPKAEAVLDGQPAMYLEEQLPHIRFTPYLKEITAESWKMRESAGKGQKDLQVSDQPHYVLLCPQLYYHSPDSGLCSVRLEGRLWISGVIVYYYVPDCKSSCRWQSGLYMKPDSWEVMTGRSFMLPLMDGCLLTYILAEARIGQEMRNGGHFILAIWILIGCLLFSSSSIRSIRP